MDYSGGLSTSRAASDQSGILPYRIFVTSIVFVLSVVDVHEVLDVLVISAEDVHGHCRDGESGPPGVGCRACSRSCFRYSVRSCMPSNRITSNKQNKHTSEIHAYLESCPVRRSEVYISPGQREAQGIRS